MATAHEHGDGVAARASVTGQTTSSVVGRYRQRGGTPMMRLARGLDEWRIREEPYTKQ